MNKTLEELKEEFLEWEANGVPLRAYVGREEALDALIAKAQESGRIEERDRVVTDGEAVMFVDPDGRPMQPIRGTG